MALLAIATLLLAPLAAGLHHHHGPGAAAGDDAGCAACLWQSHHVAALAAAPEATITPTSPLATDVSHLRLPQAELPRCAARSPPSLHA